MISGISSQIGFTEEKTDLLALRPPPDKGFDRALQRASQTRPSASDSSKSASETRHADRRRALFEERDAEPRKTEADQPGTPDGSRAAPKETGPITARSPSGEERTAVQTRASAEPASAEEQAEGIAEGTVLEDAYIDPNQAAVDAQVIHLAGLGLVTYQQSPHGLGEQQAAADAGLMLQPPVKRSESAELQVAAQALPAGEFLQKVKPEEVLPGKTPREQFPDLVKMAKPEELKEDALAESTAKAESKSDAARMALLNAMRQPPPGAKPAIAGAFAQESGAGQTELKAKGEVADPGRAFIQSMTRGAESTQTQPLTHHLAAPERGSFAVLQKADSTDNPTMERVANEVRWMIRNDRNEATIRLEPDHLGTMRIKVVQSEGTLRIEMLVDNQLARNLIESRLSDLQQRLGQHDVGAEQFSFNVNVQDGGGTDSFKQAAHTARAMPYIPASRESASLDPAITASMSRPVWGRAGVGIYA